MYEQYLHGLDSVRLLESAQFKRESPLRSADSTYAVGAIPIQSDVSPSGARTYSIPIPTAPGFKLVPSVSLGYNSQGSNGWAGYGWDIQGVSSISLINHNEYYHGSVKAASVTESDPKFALDGVPLVTNDDSATSASYPLVTATGHILAKANKYNGYVQSFSVLYPNGIQASFGWSSSTSSHMVMYRLTWMEDLEGNRINFVYSGSTDSGNDCLSSIRYGYTGSNSYIGEIVFSYISSSDAPIRYFAGRAIQNNHRLTSIESRASGILLSRYSLTYTYKDNVYLLSQVCCTNAAGESLPPLSFAYGTEPSERYLHKDAASIEIDSSCFVTEFGNIYKRGKFRRNDFRDGLLVYSSKVFEDPDWPIAFIPRLQNGTGANLNLQPGAGFQTIDAVDVDGDGVDEIVRINTMVEDIGTSRITADVYRCSGSGVPSWQFNCYVDVPGTNGSNPTTPYERAYYWGDFLGSGKPQLLAIAYKDPQDFQGTQTCYATLIDINEEEVITNQVLFDFYYDESECVFVNDIDGDGKTELCHATDTGFVIYRLQPSGSFSSQTLTTGPTATTLTWQGTRVYVTDLNGDGMLDIIRSPQEGVGGPWIIWQYTGSAFVELYRTICPYALGDTFMFMDVSRDGMSDLVRISGGMLETYINTDGTHFSIAEQSPTEMTDAAGIVPANMLELGGASAFIKLDGNIVSNYSYNATAPNIRMVKRMEDSYGRLSMGTYAYLPELTSSWTDSSYSPSLANGYSVRALPIYVLSDESSYLSSPTSASTMITHMAYSYYDGVAHSRGLGFCGFHRILSQKRNYTGTGLISSTNQTFNPEKRGVLTAVEERIGSTSGTSYYSVSNTWDSHSTTYGKLSPRLTSSVETDVLTGLSVSTDYTYDTFDFPLTATSVRTRTGQTQQREQKRWAYNHYTSTAKYLLGELAQESTVRDVDGAWTICWKNKSVYSYDNFSRVTERQDYIGTSRRPAGSFPSEISESVQKVSTTRWAYDAFGNVASQKSAPYSATEFLGTTYVYDSLGRFIVSATDALGHTTTYSGYNKYGKPACETDYAGRSVSYAYDSWGNLTQTTFADGSTQAVTTAWGGDGLYTITTTATGRPTSIVHYDALGREVRSGSQRFDSQWQWTARQYDSRGRLWKVSLPYRTAYADGTGTPLHWNTYSYDSYDRPTKVQEASGRETTWTYSGASTTTVKEGISSTKTVDTFGNLVSVVDPGGTVTYTLRDDAQPSKITAPGSVQTTFTYDAYGRRTSIVDPSAGTHSDSYVFNADGSSVTTHSGPNGTIVTSVDKYGRTTSVVRTGEFSTTYSYDTYGKLTGETSTNGTATSYVYDSLDRVVSLREEARCRASRIRLRLQQGTWWDGAIT